MAKTETLNTRVTRLENLMCVLADNQAKLDDALVLLTEAQIKTEERFQQVAQDFQATDERIGKLVSAIGVLVGKMPNSPEKN
jgi:hypothetical protein